jgi:hypothetical protein
MVIYFILLKMVSFLSRGTIPAVGERAAKVRKDF